MQASTHSRRKVLGAIAAAGAGFSIPVRAEDQTEMSQGQVYYVQQKLDFSGMGARKDEILAADTEHLSKLADQGHLRGHYVLAHGQGSSGIWSAETSGHLSELLLSLPSAIYATDLRVEPVLTHPVFPFFTDTLAQQAAKASDAENVGQLYFIEVKTNVVAAGADFPALLTAETKRDYALIDSGVKRGIWLHSHGQGAIVLWECKSAKHLNEEIAKMPLYDFFADIRVIPVYRHPAFPGFAPRRESAEATVPITEL